MNLDPLKRFAQKVNYIEQNSDLICANAARMVSKAFEDKVTDAYPTATVSLVSLDKSGNEIKAVVDVHDDELWFKEFGTGQIGKDTPAVSWEYRPKQTLTFFSRGKWQVTQGWEYMYHPKTKEKGYWVYQGQKNYGQRGQAGVIQAVISMRYFGVPNLSTWLRMYIEGENIGFR